MTTQGTIVCRYHGRDFTAGEMALMRELIASSPQQTRAGLSRAFCRAIGWVKPDGGLRDMAARVAMLRMHRDGIITLPPPRHGQPPRRVPEFGPETDPPATPMPETLDAVRPIRLLKVTGAGRAASAAWNSFIARWHYLGYTPLIGAQMRYTVQDREGRPLAMLGFSAAAWKTAPRDAFIGWSPEVRERNLYRVMTRYLIMGFTSRTWPPTSSHRRGASCQGTGQYDAGPDGDLRRNPALHRDHLQGFRMDPCRNNPGTRALRHKEGIWKTETSGSARSTNSINRQYRGSPNQDQSAPKSLPACAPFRQEEGR